MINSKVSLGENDKYCSINDESSLRRVSKIFEDSKSV